MELEFWDDEMVPTWKLGFHVAQAVVAFLIFCLEIAVFRSNNALVVGNNVWPFVLVFLSVPAWVYLIMTPRYKNTKKYAYPQLMAVVDGVFTIFWLSGFASQAAYNTYNYCGDGCSISKGVVAMEFFMTVFWGFTTFFSIYTVFYAKWNDGRLPGYDKILIARERSGDSTIDPDKEHFSASIETHGDEEAGFGGGSARVDDGVGASYNNDAPSRYPDGPEDYGAYAAGASSTRHLGHGAVTYDSGETEYRRQSPAQRYSSHGVGGYNPPSAQDEFDDGRPAHFPDGNYDAVH